MYKSRTLHRGYSMSGVDSKYSDDEDTDICCEFRMANQRMRETQKVIKERVAKSFVLPQHMPVFERVSLESNVAISVRESGSDTLKSLAEGAAAKGHNILDKTIKRNSLQKIYQTQESLDSAIAGVEKCGFKGWVGRWSNSGITGVFAHNNITDSDLAYAVNVHNPIEHELFDEWVKRKTITPYTGDYDLHDIICFKGNAGSIPVAGGAEENGIIDSINSGVSAVDPVRPFERRSMHVVRHGPQVNYVPYMWDYERLQVKKNKGYLGVVAKPGPFPIAMVFKGRWYIFETQQELFSFYNKTNTLLPTHWANELIDSGGGFVVTPEHKILLDKEDGVMPPLG